MAEDAVKVAPHVYKPILENDQVRVLDTVMKPGDKTEMHGHPAVVVYALSGGKVRFTSPNGGTMEAELPDGAAMHTDATEHATENIGDTELRVIMVEIK